MGLYLKSRRSKIKGKGQLRAESRISIVKIERLLTRKLTLRSSLVNSA